MFKIKRQKPEKHIIYAKEGILPHSAETTCTISINKYIINEITPLFNSDTYLLIILVPIRHC